MQQKDVFVNQCNVFDIADIEEEIVQIPVEPVFYTGSVIGLGSLSDSFKMSVHHDNTYLNSASTVGLGEILFTKINWKNSISKVKFYIDTCTYSCGTFSIDIVKVRY